MKYVRVDWAYRQAQWCALTGGGEVAGEGRIAADRDGLARLILELGERRDATLLDRANHLHRHDLLGGLIHEYKAAQSCEPYAPETCHSSEAGSSTDRQRSSTKPARIDKPTTRTDHPRGAAAAGPRQRPTRLQVALLVAGGSTNKEAGAALFLSAKTVEAHLGRIYRTLGLRSRTELAARFAGASLAQAARPHAAGA